MNSTVVVLGAGVLGLSCALRLKSAGYKIILVAKDLPGDLDVAYASPWAGAHFRPIPVTSDAELLERQLSSETYDYFAGLAQNHKEAGVTFCPGVEYFENPSAVYTDLDPTQQYSTWPGFRVLEPGELPLSAKWGVTYKAWVVDSPRYLRWLQLQLGEDVVIVRETVGSLSEALKIACSQSEVKDTPPLAIINASGLGLSDPSSYISRGQFLHVANSYDSTISYHCADGTSTVIVPRFGSSGTLIGGSKEPHDYNSDPDDTTSQWIVDRVSQLCPDLPGDSGLDIKSVNVGRRPMRHGGLRLELEHEEGTQSIRRPQDSMSDVAIIHCYGAGGSGFKISWGAASRVLSLVESLHRESQ